MNQRAQTIVVALEFANDLIVGFVGQEAQHFTCHRRYNERLKQAGYPELEAVEDSYTAGYERLSKRSLDFRLAYSAGFETMTMGITE